MAVDGQPEEDTSQSKLTNFCGNASTGSSNEGFENLRKIHSYRLNESTDEANTGGAKVASSTEAKKLTIKSDHFKRLRLLRSLSMGTLTRSGPSLLKKFA